MAEADGHDNLSDVMSNDSENNFNELPLTVLFKFIRPFNGDRKELNTFIQNTNSAFSLATPVQTNSLFLYVASQLSTSVVNELELNDVASWEQLKAKLKLYYSQTKHVAQAHEELETIRQYQNETVTEFFKRVEKTKNDCIQAEKSSGHSDNEFPGIKRAIQQTALRRFIIHCKPEISQMLRARDLNSLNDAYSLALQEEKIINYTRNRNTNQLYCSYCKNHTHNTQNCKKKPKSNQHSLQKVNNQIQQQTSSQQSDTRNNKTCNYCKKPGHLINECRKRQFKQQYQQTNMKYNPRVNHLNSQESTTTNAPSADQEIQEAFTTLSVNTS